MRVGLNLIFLVPGETGGMEVYARELAPRLAALEGLDVVAFVNEETAGEDLGVPTQVVPVRASNRLEWVRGEQQLLPVLAARAGIDVLHSLASTAPLWSVPRSGVRRVVTIHDLHFKLVPDAHFGVRGLGMRVLVPGAARTAHRVIVDATQTREDLFEHLGTPRSKVDVVPLGVNPVPDVEPTSARALRERLDLGDRRVVLTVSAKRPHKNLTRLIEAHALLPVPRPVLVLPGYATEHEAELRARGEALGISADLRFPAWISAADLEGLYALAEVCVLPSLYEGFGLPVLEAMARGVPVATSGRGSLAEVAGEAALLFDPESVEAIAGAVGRVLDEAGLAQELRAKGEQHACHFTWERTATSTSQTYRRCP